MNVILTDLKSKLIEILKTQIVRSLCLVFGSMVKKPNHHLNKDGIIFGLGSIKNISEKSITKLEKFKNKYSNKFEIFNAAVESELNSAIVTSIIMVGGLDHCLNGNSRNKLMLE